MEQRISFDEALRNRILRIVFYLLPKKRPNCRADAEDITQDVMVKLFKKVSTFRGESDPVTWFGVITRNAVIDFLRAEGRRSSNLQELDAVPQGLEGFVFGGSVSVEPNQYWATALHEVEEQLSNDFRPGIFSMFRRVEEGYTFKDIAEHARIPENTIKVTAYRVREFFGGVGCAGTPTRVKQPRPYKKLRARAAGAQ